MKIENAIKSDAADLAYLMNQAADASCKQMS